MKYKTVIPHTKEQEDSVPTHHISRHSSRTLVLKRQCV